MFSHTLRGKKGQPVVLDVFVDHATYDKFVTHSKKNSLSESSALGDTLERGMANYWIQEFKHLKQDYTRVEKLFTEYKRDNEILKALLRQNEQLRKILEEKKLKKDPTHRAKNQVVKT
jgi:hypothetical protein